MQIHSNTKCLLYARNHAQNIAVNKTDKLHSRKFTGEEITNKPHKYIMSDDN